MIITIIGAGTLGSHLAKYLSEEHMDIYIVDKDTTKLSLLDTEHNLMTVTGGRRYRLGCAAASKSGYL